MADTLGTLMKLAKHKVEHVQQELAVAVGAYNDLAAAKADWEGRRAAAEAAAREADEIGDVVMFGRRVAKEIGALEGKMAAQQVVVDELREKLRVEYAARERYALLLEAQKVAAAKVHAGKVQAGLDEAAAQVSLRGTRRKMI